MTVIGRVPRLHHKVGSLLALGNLAECLFLLQCRGLVGRYQVVEQLVDILHLGCHAVFQHIVGIRVVTQELGYLAAQVDEALADGQVVLVILVRAHRVAGHVHLAAQVSLG